MYHSICSAHPMRKKPKKFWSHWSDELSAAVAGVVYGLTLMLAEEGSALLLGIPSVPLPQPNPDAYTITYIVDGGRFWLEYADPGASAKGPLHAPAPPKNKHFIGWFAEDAAVPFGFGTGQVRADTTLYAKFGEYPLMRFHSGRDVGPLYAEEEQSAAHPLSSALPGFRQPGRKGAQSQ
jgi:hypothetical protein